MSHGSVSSRIVLPGSTLGVLGSGQLGRMFAIAARRMGYRVHVFSPDDDTPTGQVADIEVSKSYDDLEAVEVFANRVDVLSFEFENVPSATIEAASQFTPVRPGGHVLHTTQHRIREKTFLRDAGLPVTPFHPVYSSDDLRVALGEVTASAVLKTGAWGYDGKGQRRVEADADAEAVWNELGTEEAILEQFIDFEAELSVIAARGADGSVAMFPPLLNRHENHILDVTLSPTGLPPEVERAACEIAQAVVEKLDVTGVLCVEFFLTKAGQLYINECAPRPHNSGHLTVDAHETCQFEQQVRTICGLPLGSTVQRVPAAMVNLLGDLWSGGEPNWAAACAVPGVKLHLYGKREPRPGRKMGHLTALADDVATAEFNAKAARDALLS